MYCLPYLAVAAAATKTTADRKQEGQGQDGATVGDKEVRRNQTDAKEADDDDDDDDVEAKATSTIATSASIENTGSRTTPKQAGKSAECGRVVVGGGKENKQTRDVDTAVALHFKFSVSVSCAHLEQLRTRYVVPVPKEMRLFSKLVIAVHNTALLYLEIYSVYTVVCM